MFDNGVKSAPNPVGFTRAGMARSTMEAPSAGLTSLTATAAQPAPAQPAHQPPPAIAPAQTNTQTNTLAASITPFTNQSPATDEGANQSMAKPTPAASITNLAEARADEKRDTEQNENRAMGYVISCDGARAVIQTVADHVAENTTTEWAIGRLISISTGKSRIVGLIYKVESSVKTWSTEEDNAIIVHTELQGEVFDADGINEAVFRKGISNYPHAGAIAHRMRVDDLKTIYEKTGQGVASVGQLSQDSSVSANINVDELISKHFAILGSTGSGKSSATSLILHRIQENSPDLRILILDPHNEYSRGFKETSETIDMNTLDLPHWMFQLDEFAEVLFRGTPPIVAERDALRELIPAAKALYAQNQEAVSIRKAAKTGAATADSPVPYKISDLLSVMDEQIGLLDSTMDRATLKSLKNRIESLSIDPRFRFMFSSRMITDNAMETLGRIFRIPAQGKPISILQMAEIPSEVVSSLVSVICRLTFDLTLASAGRLKVLVVCEEAHRYIPDDKSLGFAPTRQSIARIAKEGRKYGTYLCIISQRPGELDATILSQCSTVFALRLSNEVDQDIVKKAISASSASTISFLSSIGNREAIAFGEGLATPMRMRFSSLPNEWLLGHEREDVSNDLGDDGMVNVLTQWKRAYQN